MSRKMKPFCLPSKNDCLYSITPTPFLLPHPFQLPPFHPSPIFHDRTLITVPVGCAHSHNILIPFCTFWVQFEFALSCFTPPLDLCIKISPKIQPEVAKQTAEPKKLKVERRGRGIMVVLVMVLIVSCLSSKGMLSEGLCNNLALTPPMGWTSWGRFRCNVNCKRYPKECISEWLLRDMARRMVDDGYLKAGYEYLLVDDCWLAASRDSFGRLYPDPERFPSGIKNLSNYVHSLGLKFGIYEDYGKKTCEGYPGILPSTMQLDAETFAYWEVDYVKIDGCYSEPLDMIEGFGRLGRFFLQTGRPIVYSCSWPAYQLDIGISPNYTAAAIMCNLWRNYKDIQDSWHSLRGIITYYAEHQEEFAPFAGPGHWNDPDMLNIGNFGLTYEQSRMQMALWAILAAPLIMSNDLRVISPQFRDILLDPLLIEINQDPLGIQGRRIYINKKRKYEVWTRPVLPASGEKFSWAIAIVNLDDDGEPKSVAFPLKYTKLRNELGMYALYDLFDLSHAVEINLREELITRIPPLG